MSKVIAAISTSVDGHVVGHVHDAVKRPAA
jgi:hypothetical protein